jgi:hypothetical protein
MALRSFSFEITPKLETFLVLVATSMLQGRRGRGAFKEYFKQLRTLERRIASEAEQLVTELEILQEASCATVGAVLDGFVRLADGRGEAECMPLGHVTVGRFDLFVDEDHHRAVRALWRLATTLNDAAFFECERLKIGRSRSDLDTLIEELETFADRHEIALDEDDDEDEEEDDDEDEDDDDEDDDEEDEDDDEEDEEEDDAAPRRRARQAPRGARTRANFDPRSGGFGGLDDEDIDAVRGRPAGSLSDEENFFLQRADLRWPTEIATLERAWRTILLRDHPDRAPGDPHAHHRFLLVREGYERLRRRLQ